MVINSSLDDNIKVITDILNGSGDIVHRRFPIGDNNNTDAFIIYVDGLISRDVVEDSVMTNIVVHMRNNSSIGTFKNVFDQLKNGALGTADIKDANQLDEILDAIMSGDTVLLVDGFATAIIVSSKGWPNRGVNQPDVEMVIQGSKEAFSESLRINTVLIRRRIRDYDLKIEQLRLGRRSKTDVAIAYIDGIVRPQVLQEVKDKLNKMDYDAVLDSGYIQQFFENGSIFPLGQVTERPDKTAASILEGRIAIICDNSPFVLIVPTTINTFYQTPEDYNSNIYFMNLMRIMRYAAGALAVILPALYIAVTVFHPDMLPTSLLLKMAASRTNIPFPGVVEILLMELAFELLREAGIRLPSTIGGTIGIVGGLIVGQAAVEAGIVSPIVVIVVAVTAIASFAIPHHSLTSAYALAKFGMIIFAAAFGLFGLCFGIILLTVYMASLKSFGFPYLFPFTAGDINNYSDWKDTIFRSPLHMMKKRPIFAKPNIISDADGKITPSKRIK